MELRVIEHIEPSDWDSRISGFPGKCLFHESGWLRFIQETQGGEIVRCEMIDANGVAGYFAAIIVSRGPFRILGSPLPGWSTDYLGPVAAEGFDADGFLVALNALCRELRIDHVEFCCPPVDPSLPPLHGYRVAKGITYVAPLSRDEGLMWKNLKKKSCQYAIKKALREGLTVEECRDNGFIETYYDQLREVFLKQGLVPTYSVERIRSLFSSLPPDRLLALRVKCGEETVATGIFPRDDRCLYFFGGASRSQYHDLCPNELLHWTAMRIAAREGVERYDMCGSGTFKPKFGAVEIPVYRFFRSRSVAAMLARESYKAAFYVLQRMRGSLARVVGRELHV